MNPSLENPNFNEITPESLQFLRQITPEILKNMIERKVRPTIKLIPYREGRVSVYLSNKSNYSEKLIANFLGGGIEDSESPLEALKRECKEELESGYENIKDFLVDNLPIVAYGEIATSKPRWQKKGVFLVAVEVSSLEFIRPILSEMRYLAPFSDIPSAISWLNKTDTPPDRKDLYQIALLKIKQLVEETKLSS